MLKVAYILFTFGIASVLADRFPAGWALGAEYIMLSVWFELIEPERRRALRRRDLGNR